MNTRCSNLIPFETRPSSNHILAVRVADPPPLLIFPFPFQTIRPLIHSVTSEKLSSSENCLRKIVRNNLQSGFLDIPTINSGEILADLTPKKDIYMYVKARLKNIIKSHIIFKRNYSTVKSMKYLINFV